MIKKWYADYLIGLDIKIMWANRLFNSFIFLCLALLSAPSSASDGEWVIVPFSNVSDTYNVKKEDYTISVRYSCEYKVDGYIQNITIYINENFLGGLKFDLDSEVEIEFIRDDNKLFFHKLTEEELLNILAERKAQIMLETFRFNGPIPSTEFRQTWSDRKKINGVPISDLIESGKEFGLRVMLDGTEIKRVPINLGFVVENKFKGIVRSCESDEQKDADWEDAKIQARQEMQREDLIGLAILVFCIAFLAFFFLLNYYLNKRRSNKSTE